MYIKKNRARTCQLVFSDGRKSAGCHVRPSLRMGLIGGASARTNAAERFDEALTHSLRDSAQDLHSEARSAKFASKEVGELRYFFYVLQNFERL